MVLMKNQSEIRTFFERIAFSRDAMEHFRRFHTVPSEHFALAEISAEAWHHDAEALMESLGYLAQLQLLPTLLIPQGDFSPEEIIILEKKLMDLSKKGQQPILLKSKSNHNQAVQEVFQHSCFHKILLIRSQGLLNHTGVNINRLTLRDYAPELLHPSSRPLVEWIDKFLQSQSQELSVQVVGPGELLPELLTTEGSGTLVNLGYRFEYRNHDDTDIPRLLALIENGFRRTLQTDYISSLGENWNIWMEEQQKAAIVIMKQEDFWYLDKVVVSPDHYGKGLGSLLMEELILKMKQLHEGHSALAWRARHDNLFLHRYGQLLNETARSMPMQCGTLADQHYVYHFIGLNEEQQKHAIAFMRGRPSSFTSPSTSHPQSTS